MNRERKIRIETAVFIGIVAAFAFLLSFFFPSATKETLLMVGLLFCITTVSIVPVLFSYRRLHNDK